MKLLRETIVIGSVILLALGYAGSQWFVLTGRAEAWAHLIDVPAVRWLAFAMLALAIIVGCLPEREAPQP